MLVAPAGVMVVAAVAAVVVGLTQRLPQDRRMIVGMTVPSAVVVALFAAVDVVAERFDTSFEHRAIVGQSCSSSRGGRACLTGRL